MKFRHLVLAAASAITMAACATSTPYQQASELGGYDGYSDVMLQDNVARVSFGGNSMTDKQEVETALLYRTAELALERGYDNFTLIENETEEKTRVQRSPSSQFGAGAGLYDPYFGYSFYRPRYGWSNPYRFSRFGSPYGGRADLRSGFSFGIGSGFGRSGFGSRFGYSPYDRFGFRRGFYGDPFFNRDPFFNDFDVREVTKYRAVAEARFGYGTASDEPNSFDARQVIDNLSGQIAEQSR